MSGGFFCREYIFAGFFYMEKRGKSDLIEIKTALTGYLGKRVWFFFGNYVNLELPSHREFPLVPPRRNCFAKQR